MKLKGDPFMKMINKLERKFGRYAIKNLSLYLILGYVIGYLLLMFAPQVLSKLILVPAIVRNIPPNIYRLYKNVPIERSNRLPIL